jgi:hypothetical protein
MKPQYARHIARDIQAPRLPQISFSEGAIDWDGRTPHPSGSLADLEVARAHHPRLTNHGPRNGDDAPITCERLDGLIERDAIDMSDKLDDITAATAAATIPDLTFQVNSESVPATAHRTGAAELSPDVLELNASTAKLVFQPNSLGMLDRSGAHSPTSSSNGRWESLASIAVERRSV